MAAAPVVSLEAFARRQFKAGYKGTFISGLTPEQVEAKVNEYILEKIADSKGAASTASTATAASEGARTSKLAGLLVDGYAPFCKHIFMPNFIPDALSPVIEITEKNVQFLRTGYEARTAQELPVLERWFSKGDLQKNGIEIPKEELAMMSKEEQAQENKKVKPESAKSSLPAWGIISIKAQDVDYEIPMSPITMLRNALGKEEGGSGVPLSREKYLESVKFWSKHAAISATD